MEEIKVYITQDNILSVVTNLIGGLLIIVPCIFLFHRNEAWTSFFILVSFKIFIYQHIELWVGKTFTKKGDTIYVKCMGLCLKLNSAKSFLRIDNTINISTSGVKHPTLNVYRNSPYIIGRLFKNKIKLYDITEDNYEKMKIEAQRIADLLGIPFKDSYDFDDPW